MSHLATLTEENSEDFALNDSSERDGAGLASQRLIDQAGIFEGSDEYEEDEDADDEDDEDEEEDGDIIGGEDNDDDDDDEGGGKQRRAMKYGQAAAMPDDGGHASGSSIASSNNTVNNESRTSSPTPISPRNTTGKTRAALQQKQQQQQPDLSKSQSFRRANSGAPGTFSSSSMDASKSFRISSSGSTVGGSGGNSTPNKMDFNSLSRSSRHLADSIVNKSMALARLTSRPSSMEEDAATAVLQSQQPKRNIYRGYVVGDSVLVSIDHLPYSRGASLVNKLGYPYGAGTTEEEKRGPYVYVLAKVKRVHFEEYSVYYTVTREDTGADMRGEAETMEPMRSVGGEEAARKAAQEFVPGGDDDDGENSVNNDQSERTGGVKVMRLVEPFCVILLLPFLWLYDCFVFVIGARLYRWVQTIFVATRRQAHLFLNGMKPYQCSVNMTAVHLTVLCSGWYMFIDQARLAFMPVDADYTLAIINFVIWTILVIELVFEVFIRPDRFSELIVSDKAFTPTTVRFISFLHLTVEFISLVFFVPEFVCLFTNRHCDDRSSFSFLNAALLTITSTNRIHALVGRAFFACIRLRVFGLVRHWKNMLVKKTFIMRFRSSKNYDHYPKGRPQMYKHTEGTNHGELEEGEPLTAAKKRSLAAMAKAREAALVNASNIGTALMVTNSYRTLLILCAIMGLFPMISLIHLQGVTNPVAIDMIEHLQATNAMAVNEDAETCDFLVGSVETWVKSWDYRQHQLATSKSEKFLVSLAIQPARCVTQFFSLGFVDDAYAVEEAPCKRVGLQYGLDVVATGECIAIVLSQAQGKSLRKEAEVLDLRYGAIQSASSKRLNLPMEYQNVSTTQIVPFKVVANFNHTYSVEASALSCLLLQISLLVTVLGGLSVLRKDAEVLVLGPLRSMLKIVAQYAKNPLSSARTGSKEAGSDDETQGDDSDDEAVGNQVGNYETEQLITAVSKITDLLRKCWGVAGADIISTNLVSRDGTFAEVFNPTVPGKSVYALFAFAAIGGFDHALKCLGGDVMILINDVALVLHGEVYRWGFGRSGQCNKNLGAAFLMVFRIGLVKEVVKKLEEATAVVFDGAGAAKRAAPKRRAKLSAAALKTAGGASGVSGLRTMTRGTTHQLRGKTSKYDGMDQAMQLSLQSLPGISAFTDRAVIGMLKSFAGIHRDNKLRAWGRDFRLSAGVGAFSVSLIFGMDAGWAVEGAVGSEHKIDATYLSPHVNMASRMMSACKHYGVTILFSEAVQELMSDAAKGKLRNLDRVTVKGSSRIQKIFTYDARSKGADFFLFSRSDEQADMEAERYVPSMWNEDQDLTAMRHHVTDDFELEYTAGLKAYYDGDWQAAIAKLENANEIMVGAAMEEGYLHDELDDTPDRKEMYRTETCDGPCVYLVNFMKSKGGIAPDGWAGWHPLLSK